MTHDQQIFCICYLDSRVKRAEHGIKFFVVMPIDENGEQAGSAEIAEWRYDFEPPKQSEIDAFWAENSWKYELDPWAMGLESGIRMQRDMRLEQLDAYISNPLRWASLSTEQQQELVDYRQALLDVPQQEGFPENVVFPDKPDFIK